MQYAWLIWSLILIGVWLAVYFALDTKDKKREMLAVSWWTSLIGLTEPFFVPEYWNPPSLFNLAERTGFDMESLIFSFGIGGIAVAVYERIFRVQHERITLHERHSPAHRYHQAVLLSTPVVFLILMVAASLNPIYSAILAMVVGGFFALYCRPDLARKMLSSSVIFLAIYFVYFLTLTWMYPGYVELVWNLGDISGILLAGVPLEELLFALSFGFLWSGIYEHFRWRRIKNA